MRKRRPVVGFLALLVLGPWLAWKLIERDHHLSFVPEAMQVWRILYVAEESWGFGPGGNETGIIVYEMPRALAAKLGMQGKGFLEELPKNQRRGWEGRYWNWSETPVLGSPRWETPDVCDNGHDARFWTCPGIGDFMFKYGFTIPFDKEVEAMVNAALFSEGNSYAHGRIGLILLIPDERRIVYAYNG